MTELEIKESINFLSEFDIYSGLVIHLNPFLWYGIHINIENHLGNKDLVFRFLFIDSRIGLHYPYKDPEIEYFASRVYKCEDCGKEIGGTEIEICNECYNKRTYEKKM